LTKPPKGTKSRATINLLTQFFVAIENAWNRITNKRSMPEAKQNALVSEILDLGLQKLRAQSPKAEARTCDVGLVNLPEGDCNLTEGENPTTSGV
jgi:hypothetical protein